GGAGCRRREQVCHVDAAPHDRDPGRATVERRNEVRRPTGVGDGGQNGPPHRGVALSDGAGLALGPPAFGSLHSLSPAVGRSSTIAMSISAARTARTTAPTASGTTPAATH